MVVYVCVYVRTFCGHTYTNYTENRYVVHVCTAYFSRLLCTASKHLLFRYALKQKGLCN